MEGGTLHVKGSCGLALPVTLQNLANNMQTAQQE